MRLMTGLLIAVLLASTQMAREAGASDADLWQQARAVAPNKPRVLLVSATVEVGARHYLAACAFMRKAVQSRPIVVQEWDDLIQKTALLNLQTLYQARICS